MSNKTETRTREREAAKAVALGRHSYRHDRFEDIPGEEVTARRGANFKDFDLGAGRHQAVVYPHNIHFKEGGRWREIDNTLDETVINGERVLRNRANALRVTLPCEHADSAICAEHSGRGISWRFVHAARSAPDARITGGAAERMKRTGRANISERMDAAQSEAAVEYRNIAPGLHTRIVLTGDALKQDIILSSESALPLAALELTTPGVHPEADENGRVRIMDDASGEELFAFNPPHTYDAAGNETVARVIIAPGGHPGVTLMRYELDAGFMAHAQYPVTIDPLVKSSQTGSAITDNYVNSNAENTVSNETGSSLHICSNTGSGTRMAFIQCPSDNLPKLDSSCTVTKAYLQVALRDAAASTHYIGLREVEGAWDSRTITFKNRPEVSDFVLDYITVAPADAVSTRYQFDISNIVRKWYAEPESNHGVCLESLTNASGYVELQSFNQSTSSSRPQFIINYITNAGLSGNTQYDTHSAGRAGNASVNLFNGNLVMARPLTAGTGSRMPVSVAAYYNSCAGCAGSMSAATPMGAGWRLSCDEFIGKEVLGDKTYYYLDTGSGARNYFEPKGSSTTTYKDMDGLSLTMTVSSSSITIKDKQDAQSVYRKLNTSDEVWHIDSSTNALGESVTYAYTGGLLTGITDPSGRTTTLSYSGGMLSSVRDAAGNGVSLTVDSAEPRELVTIVDDDMVETTYMYKTPDGASGFRLLNTAQDEGSCKLVFEYEDYAPFRVKGCSCHGVNPDFSEDANKGAACQYDYRNAMTRVCDMTAGSANKSLYYYFNDWGNVVSVRDDMNNAQYASFPAANLPNHPSEVSKMQHVVRNLFEAHHFAAQDNRWTLSCEDGASGSNDYSSTVKRMGMNTLRLSRTSTAGRLSWYTSQRMGANTTYTASVYVRGAAGMKCRIRVNNSHDPYVYGDTVALTDEWQRATVTFSTNNAFEYYWFSILISGGTGTAYLSSAQLEEGDVANQYNMLENSNFEYGTETTIDHWTPYDQNTADDIVMTETEFTNVMPDTPLPPQKPSDTFLLLNGAPDKTAGVYQELPISGSKGDVYVVGGWAQGKSKPVKGEDRRYCIRLAFKVSGTYENAGDIKWNEEWTEWQYTSGVCIAPASYTAVRYDVSYQRNVNYARFCDFALYREEFGTSYAYDPDGNILDATTLAGTKSYATYDSFHNMTGYRQPGRSSSDKYTMYWGTSDAERKKHLINNIQTPEGVVNAYLYDEYGNRTLSRTRDTGRSIMMDSSAEYSAAEGHNYLTKQTDSRGNSTTYVHDPLNGTLTSATMPNGQTLEYQYDGMKRMTSVETDANGGSYRNEYAYDADDDRLKTVRHNTTGAAMDVEYTFDVDNLGNPTETKVGSQVLSRNVYTGDARRQLVRTEFGNGGKIHYFYDSFDRVIGMKYDDESDTECRYGFFYGANGEVAAVGDNNLRVTTKTQRDLANRVSHISSRSDVTGEGYEVAISYDDYNNVSAVKERVGNVAAADTTEYATTYAYDRDNRPTAIQYGDASHRVTHSYDSLGRASQRKVFNGSSTTADVTTTYEYLAGAPISGVSATSTTPLVSQLTQTQMSFAYTYDPQTSNLTSVRHITGTTPASADKYTYYVYDAIGQLIRVNDQTDTTAGSTGTTWVYEYDFGGNMLARKRYPYQTGTVSGTPVTTVYTYADSNWKDKVTSIGGQAIQYDAIGNVVNDGEWTYTWQAGRQLASMTGNGGIISYKYDHNGMRVSKTVNGVETKYILNGSRVMHMTRGADYMHFHYDGSGRVSMAEYNGETFTYLHNLQSDVVGMLDAGGNLVVEYSYDAWGKPTAATGSMAGALGMLNPFRYRGYVWDEETGLYYLQSRYYRPDWGRFVSADNAMGTAGALMGHNLFAYCANSPTLRSDSSGMNWLTDAFHKVGEWVSDILQAGVKANELQNKQSVELADKAVKFTKELAQNAKEWWDDSAKPWLQEKFDQLKEFGLVIGQSMQDALNAQVQADILSRNMSYTASKRIYVVVAPILDQISLHGGLALGLYGIASAFFPALQISATVSKVTATIGGLLGAWSYGRTFKWW